MDYINEMNNLVASISSREVAEMMEVQHKNLISKIEKHTEILEKVNELNFKLVDLWQLSSYKDAKGETRKEYQVTKKGCEFLAHKTTGEKGDLFTIRYMNKFEEMEQYIKEQQVPQLTEKQMLQLQILNGDEMERIGALKQYEGVITKPLIDTIEKQSDAINELKPHAEYAERVLEDKKTLLTPTQIAKDFGMAGKALNALLHDLGVQYKQNGQWLLYAKYQGKGYTGPYQPDIPNAKPQTRWTQAGKKFIHDILRKNGYKTILENQQEQQRFDFN
ncbi:phage regulatory protein/antirepressor Ant [Intestinibacter bartlettii]|uniref:phage regulatory protein/antirepressor Ant n=1 Tax=Intestinibacter bartlettii TaxID=261299 RepID=UPI0020514043|nr:MAG TPA: regulatory protein [Caudoviricetes sp.]